MTISWEEFIKDIAGKRGLSVEEEQMLLARFPSADERVSERRVAGQFPCSEGTVKKTMGDIYSKFAGVCTDLVNREGAGKNLILHNFLRQEYRSGGGSLIWRKPGEIGYSEEFKALIIEKIKQFCGREFVFAEFDRFMEKYDKGYFTVIGDAGMGKTALSAKLVSERHYLHHFNILNENRNTSDFFLRTMRQQLIRQYELVDAETDNLPTLLEKARQKLPTGQSLILVVDALDEVNQEPGGNLLNLPMNLPEGVYFFLTRRPYTIQNKRLTVSPEVPCSELDLREEKYMQFSEKDIKAYIRLVLQDQEFAERLQGWIAERNTTTDEFVKQIAAKSENNFMYLRYLLPAIAEGQYNDLQLAELPQGLDGYYQTHWQRMGMESEPQKFMVIILFILTEVGTPIPCDMIAKIAKQDEVEVENVLERWIEYLRIQHKDGECCYSIYHASFLRFLENQRELKHSRELFREVNQRIDDYLEEEME
ncbi:NACHT domain-containing protein [Roseofilum casamattae]|uniref:NACHT domain-containing protein n=1 Tax=Roseofilum casamattae BLCC-M143 TaxID=3022442 RepID=A0ABT7BVT7_9CYAN|nr:NACHT domain-containing protein [Roseofilum casamattae]MDJ1183312.1 NACHT domain-containing protein [Roseofilum casamattae BLCC-M143]